MTDYFSHLSEPRRPWLEPELLKQKFLSRSAAVHPDRAHPLGEAERAEAQSRYTELNTAYTRLREPKDRLRHLIELERGAAPKDIQEIPADLMNLFLVTSQLCRQADAVIAEKSRTTSPLIRVQLLERGQVWSEKLTALQDQIRARRAELVVELKTIDAVWDSRLDSPITRLGLLDRLEQLYRLFSYFDRWLAQLQERLIRLSF